jgi:hypothetical protein
MALQPFVGPWSLFQFRNLFYTVGRTPWTSDQPIARSLPAHRTTQTQIKAHALSGIQTHDPSVRANEDSSYLNRATRVTGRISTVYFYKFGLEEPAICSLLSLFWNKKFWEGIIANIPLIRHGSHRKRRVQQFFYCCVCIHCHGNVFTETLPSNERRYTYEHRLMGGIWDGLRCHNIHTVFENDWLRHSRVNGGDTQTHSEMISWANFFFF